jgi:hypothetical protein
LGRCVPFPFASRRGIRKKSDRSGDLVAGEGIGDLANGLGRAEWFGSGRKEMKPPPPIRGMLAGEPDRFPPADDENMFVEAGGGRSWVSAGGKVQMGGTDRAEGARGAERVFWKADEGTEFHQGLIVSAGIFFGNEGSGDGTKLREGWGTASAGEESTQNSSHISVEGGCGNIERDTGNSACGVVADSWKLKKFFRIGGESALRESKN